MSGMICPNCREKAVAFSQFVLLHPFKEFECRSCGAMLKMDLTVRLFCILTFYAVAVSFYFIFPIMHDWIYSHSSWIARLILGIIVPLPAIAIQVTVIFIPVSLYTWLWGEVEIVSLPDEDR